MKITWLSIAFLKWCYWAIHLSFSFNYLLHLWSYFFRPDIFAVLVQKLQSGDVLLSERVYMVLNQVLKELSTKRLIADQKNLMEVNTHSFLFLEWNEVLLAMTMEYSITLCLWSYLWFLWFCDLFNIFFKSSCGLW